MRRVAPKKQTRKPRQKTPPSTDIPLPTERQQPSTDIRDYSILLYGPPKIGKTVFFSTFPDVLFLCAEPGASALPIYSYNSDGGGVHSWGVAKQAVRKLESSEQFLNVCIDTLDEIYRLCQEDVCRAAGVEHPHDANDYGKTWDKVTNEFCGVFRRIKHTGRGLYMTSHSKEGVVRSASGAEFTRIGPSLTGKSGAKLLALVDFIFYIDFYKIDGRDTRVVCTVGNELVTAGQRKIGQQRHGIPQFIPLPDDESKDYDVFAAAFRGEVEGIDPTKVMPSRAGTKTGAEAAKKTRMDMLSKRRKGE